MVPDATGQAPMIERASPAPVTPAYGSGVAGRVQGRLLVGSVPLVAEQLGAEAPAAAAHDTLTSHGYLRAGR